MIENYDAVEAYKKAIRLKYVQEKTSQYASFLLNPSRAKLRQLCVERFKNNLNDDDLKSFRLFFRFDFRFDSLNKLKVETDKFRPIETFFKGETDLSDIEAVNIAAILVDFNPRPFHNYVKVALINNDSDVKHLEVTSSQSPIETIKKNLKNKLAFAALSVVAVLSVGYTANDILFPESECMQWNGDHYEVVTCLKDVNSLESVNKAELFDAKEFNRKKLEVCDTTTFFKGDKPIVWYSKKNKKISFYNMDGYDPNNGCELKHITNYMIDKYVKPCK